MRRLVRHNFGELGLRRIWVFRRNERAIRSYEKAGFTRCGTAVRGATVLMERRSPTD